MTDFGDFIAHGVITQALVCEGDETLEDLGIMSLEPGQVILKCNGARRIDPDDLHAVPGYTPNWVVRQNMLEYNEWMEKATALIRDMWRCLSDLDVGLINAPMARERIKFYKMRERYEALGLGE